MANPGQKRFVSKSQWAKWCWLPFSIAEGWSINMYVLQKCGRVRGILIWFRKNSLIISNRNDQSFFDDGFFTKTMLGHIQLHLCKSGFSSTTLKWWSIHHTAQTLHCLISSCFHHWNVNCVVVTSKRMPRDPRKSGYLSLKNANKMLTLPC